MRRTFSTSGWGRNCGPANSSLSTFRIWFDLTAASGTLAAFYLVGPHCSSLNSPVPEFASRVDKWLWSVRLYRTRSLASDACRAGSVRIGDQPVKPARDVRPGEMISVRQGVVERTLVVLAVPKSRVGAPQVGAYCEDRTPPGEWEKAREQRVQHLLARERGSGRPTKRDRRQIDRLMG